MINTFRNTIAGASAIVLLGLTAASAATVYYIDGSTQGLGNTAGIGYAAGYGANTPTGATWSVDPTWEAPPEGAGGISQSPFNYVAGLEGTQDYFTIGGVLGSNGALSPVSLTFTSLQSAFTFLWGSIDSYNSIDFVLGEVFGSRQFEDVEAAGDLGGVYLAVVPIGRPRTAHDEHFRVDRSAVEIADFNRFCRIGLSATLSIRQHLYL